MFQKSWLQSQHTGLLPNCSAAQIKLLPHGVMLESRHVSMLTHPYKLKLNTAFLFHIQWRFYICATFPEPRKVFARRHPVVTGDTLMCSELNRVTVNLKARSNFSPASSSSNNIDCISQNVKVFYWCSFILLHLWVWEADRHERSPCSGPEHVLI